jgi:hypothetical protein
MEQLGEKVAGLTIIEKEKAKAKFFGCLDVYSTGATARYL